MTELTGMRAIRENDWRPDRRHYPIANDERLHCAVTAGSFRD